MMREDASVLGAFTGRGVVDLNDPDANYFNNTKRLHHLDDFGSDEEPGSPRVPDAPTMDKTRPSAQGEPVIAPPTVAAPGTAEGK